jgi:hypothetical protein
MIDGHKLCKRSPVGEPGLELSVAHLLLAPSTGLALAARAHEGNGDPVTDMPSLDSRADAGDHAGELMARDVGESDTRIVTHPAMPVTSAQTSGCHLNDHAGVRANGVINGDYLGQSLESLVKYCTHCRSPRQICRDARVPPGNWSEVEGITKLRQPRSETMHADERDR